jgi:23S rRNA pseudoU1915 N3-methylase RlmH
MSQFLHINSAQFLLILILLKYRSESIAAVISSSSLKGKNEICLAVSGSHGLGFL